MPYHTHNHSNEGDSVYTTISKYEANNDNKGMFKGKTEYYVLAAGVIGAAAAIGLAALQWEIKRSTSCGKEKDLKGTVAQELIY